MTTSNYRFNDTERDTVYRVIEARRDMRHFYSGSVSASVMQRLLQAAHQAPSVGLMQPWRIIQINDKPLRQSIYQLVEQERLATAKALDKREDEFMRLKVEGIQDCAELLVISLMNKREEHVFGRRTMPEMDLASVSCAIQNMWLAARAENLGMGWVSLFEPKQLAALLNMPDDAAPIAIICLGPVTEFYPIPMLQQQQWRQPAPLAELLYENSWGKPAK